MRINEMSKIQAYYSNKISNIPDIEVTEISRNEMGIDLWIVDLKTDSDNKLKPTFNNSIYRDGVLNRLNKMGYFKFKTSSGNYNFVKKSGCFIEKVTVEEVKDDFYFNHIKNLSSLIFKYYGEELFIRSEKLKEVYLNQYHLCFNKNFLEFLPTLNPKFLRDTKECSFFCFENSVFIVRKNSVKSIDYEVINSKDYCVWKEHIINHELEFQEKPICNFQKFIKNVCNGNTHRVRSLRSAIGYLSNTFSEPNKGQVVVLCDEEVSESGVPQGGTGKGIIAKAIEQIRNVTKVDGKKFDSNDKFRWQRVTNETEVVLLDDVRENFNFSTLYSCTNDGWNIEAKYKSEEFISPEESPKIIITSNKVLDNRGSTNKRRQFVIELSDYYSKSIITGTEEPIIKEHGVIFFNKTEWDKNEWDSFYSYMLECSQHYLKNGLISYQLVNAGKNFLIHKAGIEFVRWIETKNFEFDTRYFTEDLYEEFILDSGFTKKSFSQRTFSNCINLFTDQKNWDIVRNRSNGKSVFHFESLQVYKL